MPSPILGNQLIPIWATSVGTDSPKPDCADCVSFQNCLSEHQRSNKVRPKATGAEASLRRRTERWHQKRQTHNVHFDDGACAGARVAPAGHRAPPPDQAI
jgi:hypothetical protein